MSNHMMYDLCSILPYHKIAVQIISDP